MIKFNSIIPKRIMTRVFIVLCMFVGLLIGSIMLYWHAVVISQIQAEEQAKVDLLAPFYARQVSHILDVTDLNKRNIMLDQWVGSIMLSLDPTTNKPMFEGLEIELTDGITILERLPKAGFSGFVSRELITSEKMQIPMGLFSLYYSGEFFDHLRRDAEKKLIQWFGGVLFALVLLWILLRELLRPLSTLSSALKDWRPEKKGQNLPDLKYWASYEICLVQGAMEVLLKEQAHARKFLEERVKARTRELTQAKEEAARIAEYANGIIRSMSDSLIIVSPDGFIESLNSAGCLLLGYEEDELVGQPIGNVVVEDVFQQDEFSGSTKKESVSMVDVHYATKDEEKIPVSLSCSIMKSTDKHILGCVYVARDMRPTQRLIADMEIAKNFSDSIVNSIPVGLATLAEDFMILSVNRWFISLFKERSLVGSRLIDINPSSRINEIIGTVLNGASDIHELEIPFTAEGEHTESIFNLSVVSLSGSQGAEVPSVKKGRAAKVLVVCDDITDRKKAEKELEKHRFHLEELVDERTDSLKEKQAQLVQSGKLASIGELSAGVAHELNQPLMVIRGNTQLILRNLRKGKVSEDDLASKLEMVERNTKRMMDIINHLRIFSRQADSNYEPLNVNKIIEDCFLMVGEQLRLHNIEVEKHLAPDLPKVEVNANQLEQVFLNLITNARDAVDESVQAKNKYINIKTGTSDGNRNAIEILIKDNGNGITSDVVDSIFNPFFTTKEVGKGTGLGLSISYGIIEEHNGKIDVAETGPDGTTLRIELPVANLKAEKI